MELPSQQTDDNVAASASPQRQRTSRASLDVATSVPLPPSSPVLMSPRDPQSHRMPRITPDPLRRTSSSLSLGKPPSSPSLLHHASTSSLRNGDGPLSPGSPSRRTSAQHGLPSPLGAPSEERLVTANTVAADYFARDLAQHGNEDRIADTVVILHDDCYGHRFARPSSKRMAEQNIEYTFERPERIHATVLGLSSAYLLLGDRHAEGRHAPHPKRSPPPSIPFRIRKTTRAIAVDSSVVTAVHGAAWMKELGHMCESAAERLPHGNELDRIKESASEKAKEALHSGDLYLCPESRQAFEGALGGVCDGVDAVFKGSESGTGPHKAYVSIRPPGHHCAAHMPSGFCWLNNVHVGIEYASQNYGLTHAAIFDFDLHHGDGSQAIAWQRNAKAVEAMQPSAASKDYALKPRSYANHTAIGYYSIHDIESYPCESGDQEAIRNASVCIDNSHGQSIWNVHLEAWTTPEEFWKIYESKYLLLLDKMRAFLKLHTEELGHQLQDLQSGRAKKLDRSKPRVIPRPKAAIFISAGFDASEHENPFMQRHGKRVLTEFYARITQDLVKLANEPGTSVNGRVISVLEGGYSDKALVSGVMSHLCGLCSPTDGSNVTPTTPTKQGQLGTDLAIDLERLSLRNGDTSRRYDASWWEHSRLLALAQLLDPSASPAPLHTEPKKSKIGGYSDPTQASTARAIDPAKIYRSTSWSANRTHASPSANSSRAPSPTPPEVSWLIAAEEICKLLVPTHRSIKSHTVEELTLIAAVKKARHTTIGLHTTEVTSERQLRDRKTKLPMELATIPDLTQVPADLNGSQPKARVVSRSDRRKTMADLPLVNDLGEEPIIPPRTRRRSSIASTMSIASVTNPSVLAVKQPAPRATKPSTVGVQAKKVRATSGSASITPPAQSSRLSSDASMQATAKASPPGQTKESTPDALDALTSGLKRIKINVPTDEEYAARQASKAVVISESRTLPGKLIAPRTTSRKATTSGTRSIKTTPKETKVKPKPAMKTSSNGISSAVTTLKTAEANATNHRIGQPPASPLLISSSLVDQPRLSHPAEKHQDHIMPVAQVEQGVDRFANSTITEDRNGLQQAPLQNGMRDAQVSAVSTGSADSTVVTGARPGDITVDQRNPEAAVTHPLYKAPPKFSAMGHIPFASQESRDDPSTGTKKFKSDDLDPSLGA